MVTAAGRVAYELPTCGAEAHRARLAREQLAEGHSATAGHHVGLQGFQGLVAAIADANHQGAVLPSLLAMGNEWK